MSYLERRGDWTPTLDIAKEMFGRDATKAAVNPTLYSLRDDGVLEKGNNCWRYSRKTENVVTTSVNTEAIKGVRNGWKRCKSKTTWRNPLYSRNLDLAEAVPIISTKNSIENSGKLLTFHTLWQFLHECRDISTLSTPINPRKWVAWATLRKNPIYIASNFGSEPKRVFITFEGKR